MSASYGNVTITTTATSIVAPSVAGRRGFVLTNNGSVVLYLGFDSSVSTTNGIQILPQDKFEMEGDDAVFKGPVYGITGSSTADVRYWNWSE